MRQLGLFEHQDLKEFTKWDSGCEISGEGGTSGGQNFRMWDIRVEMVAEKDSRCESSGWNGGGERFRVWDTRMEMAAEKDSGCETPRWKWRRRKIPGVRHSDENGGTEGFRVWDTWMEMAAQKDSGCETPGWNDGGERFRVWDTWMEMLLWVARRIGMGCLDMKAWVSDFNGYVKEWRMTCTCETPCKWGGE